jgi:hypothetical protein
MDDQQCLQTQWTQLCVLASRELQHPFCVGLLSTGANLDLLGARHRCDLDGTVLLKSGSLLRSPLAVALKHCGPLLQIRQGHVELQPD